jgi:hypothetical protein
MLAEVASRALPRRGVDGPLESDVEDEDDG